MPAQYTRTINWTGENTGAGANYTWTDVNGAVAQGWITYAETGSNTDAWEFNITDNTAPNAVTRSAKFRVQHWSYTDGTDLNTWDEFTITQYASGTSSENRTSVTAATAATTLATDATTLATNATAATTEATGATAATTESTGATAATTAPTNATAATTAPTNATAATTAPTNATAATTQAIAKTIVWTNDTATIGGNGQSLQRFVQVDSGSGNGDTLSYTSASSGGGAGNLHWASDAAGANPISAPSWASVNMSTTPTFGSGSGVGDAHTARVIITINEFAAATFATAATTQATISSGGSGSGGGSGNIR